MRDTEKGSLKPTKGLRQGLKWIIFDATPECRGEECENYHLCPYEKVGKCTVESKYVSSVFDSIIDDIGDKLTQRLLNKISLHLFPLFQQLVRMKLVSLGIKNPVCSNNRGGLYIHPVYAEIRNIINAIERTQRSMGLDGEYYEVKGWLRGKKDGAQYMPGDNGLPSANGDSNWVAQMSEVEKEETAQELFPEGKRRGVKRSRAK